MNLTQEHMCAWKLQEGNQACELTKHTRPVNGATLPVGHMKRGAPNSGLWQPSPTHHQPTQCGHMGQIDN